MAFHCPDKYRQQHPAYPSLGDETCGYFVVPLPHAQTLRVIASSEGEWEHVSVSRKDRCPTWDEMCKIKALFWDEEDCVVQYHPPKSDYVNNHPFCLHLFRPTTVEMPRPPSIMVGL